jgi:hypothetical protein
MEQIYNNDIEPFMELKNASKQSKRNT